MAASAAPVPSLADKYKLTDAEAIAHFEAGNLAYKAGADKSRSRPDRDRDLERAVAEYTAGQAKQDRPVFDYNLGLAYKALGRTDEAIEHLQRFLDLADATVSSAVRTDVENKLAALDPAGKRRAELAKKRATAPPSAPVPPPVVPPMVATERAPMAPSAPPAAPSISPPGMATTKANAPRGSPRWPRVGGWGLTAIGLAGAGVTTWLLVDARSLDSEADNAQAHHLVSERQQLADRASERRRSAVLVGVGSGVLLASGALVLVLWSGGDPAPARVGWNLGITGNGMAVSGRF
jgi:tetratricopeptide (TPR) repeat protein